MTPTQQLKAILNNRYISIDEDEYQVELMSDLPDEEIERFANTLPKQRLPADIKELLKFARGFKFWMPDEIVFDGVGMFGLEEIFPCSIQLASDGFGNFWIVDVLPNGDWGHVYYVCHDPSVIVKHSENLAEFIYHIHEFASDMEKSNLNIIHEQTVSDIYLKNNGLIENTAAKQSADTVLKDFANQFPDNYLIADLRNKPNKSGFDLHNLGPNCDTATRHPTELLWALKKYEKKEKKGFFARLLGR